MMMSRGLWLLVLACLLGWAKPVTAHPILQTMVEVRLQPKAVRLHLVLPSSELAFALVEAGQIPRPPPLFKAYPALPASMVRAYVFSHLAAKGRDGQAWRVAVQGLAPPNERLPDGDPAKDWLVDVDLIPPDGQNVGSVVLRLGTITREVVNHTAIVSLMQDWQGGVLPQNAVLLGRVERGEGSIAITPGAGLAWKAMVQMVQMGLWHIAEGADHQAFLLTLLLTAGLIPLGKGWVAAGGWRALTRDVVWRASAFTLGHSLSLLATSLGWLPEGGQRIELLIALSVALSALHTLHPIYAGRETWIAGFFGLIHGMAFATAIRDMALPVGQVLLATLGFNIGIELAQLALVAVALPVVLMSRQWDAEAILRWSGALLALGCALVWVVERI
ncbi:HupE/UreJ family protein [Novosphingobium umbonatum]|uniref:HupE/UreJ family protein n=1 Tax=Novosphingobium umbonatum TaxID=1908524 RepID=A0A437NC93_9SPHN|nr:HupE/UreJ family protein [Novosphingobium umbonatum]RVU07565.1 HupE/UreJ family protein [Novosphingobium umbonatum]